MEPTPDPLRAGLAFSRQSLVRAGSENAILKEYWIAAALLHSLNAMPIHILQPAEVEAMRRAGRCAAQTLASVVEKIEAGVSTKQIDQWVREDTQKRGAEPSQLGYHGFPAAVCTSVNEVACHGLPRADKVLRSGDIINVDVTSQLDGYHADTSRTIAVGEVTPKLERLCRITQECLYAGISVVRHGARLGDIGAIIQDIAHSAGFSVVREYGGHGIGKKMHLDPHVAHVGSRGKGLRLKAGMALTIEPILVTGDPSVELLDDGWTVVTRDRSYSAQFEHTILVTAHGAEILTLVAIE